MELWAWVLVGLLYGLGFSSSLVRAQRQSDTWWRSQQHGRGSSRALGQPASRLGSPRANPLSRAQSGFGAPRALQPVSGFGAPRAFQPVSGFGASRAFQPVSGWGSRYLGRPQSRQLVQPTPSPFTPIGVQCDEDRMVVMVRRDFYGNNILLKASDLTLGSCSPGSQSTDVMLVFDNEVQACGSTLQVTQDLLIYKNMLDYNPVSINTVILRSTPAMVPILCYYPRHGNVSSKAIRPTWSPFTTTVSTEDRLLFSMYLMNDDWSDRRTSSIFHLGDVFNVEASVETTNHVPMFLFVDYCVATPTPDINSQPRYDIVAYNGCLVDGTQEDSSSAFRSPRSELNKIQFMVDAFWFVETAASRIYITCSLKAVHVNHPIDPMNKACSYNKATRSWIPLEGRNDICRCCDTMNCAAPIGPYRRVPHLPVFVGPRHFGKRETALHPEEQAMATLGPILVIGVGQHHAEPVAERVQAAEVSEESPSSELWMLVAVGSVSVVVVVVALFVTANYVVKRPSA